MPEIEVPGSKSLINRALILAALNKGKTTIKNAAICDDTKFMIQGLKKLGLKIEQNRNTIKVTGPINKDHKNIEIYTENAGTTTRFLTALGTTTDNTITITGNKRMQKRPIQPLVDALNKLGADISSTNNCPPLKSNGKKAKGGKINLQGNISSQYLSAILMIAPFLEEDTVINIEQELCSRPYIKMTIKMMEDFELSVMNNNFEQFLIKGKHTVEKSINITIESDASSASYLGAFAALHPEKTITIKNLTQDSIQGDIVFLEYLQKMGCKIEHLENKTKITGINQLERLGEIDMNKCPDLVMTFAILATLTPGITKIKNISNLRIKETDRLQALENELKKIEAKVETGSNFITIQGNPNLNPPPCEIETYDDHRIAMSFGILQTVFPQIKIKNPECVSKSYPTFWQDLEQII